MKKLQGNLAKRQPTLVLSNLNLDADAGKIIADALLHHATLTTLNLYCNRLGYEGVNAIANALKYNTSLST